MIEGTTEDTELETADIEMKELGEKLKSWFQQDITRVIEWRKEAREDYKFYSGDQWDDDDLRVLREKKRPAMVFDRVAPLVNAVVGSEINNRRETQYIPRELGDASANEVLTGAGEWFRDEANAEDEESDAFQDCVIGGMGFTDTRLDFESNPDGAPKVERLDPFKFVWDGNSSKPNLEDAQRMFYVDEKPYSEAREMFPDVAPELLDASWARTLNDDSGQPHNQDLADLYEGDQKNGQKPWSKRVCTIVEARWFERQAYYRGPNIDDPSKERDYAEDELAKIRSVMPQFPAVRQYRKVVKRAFIGKEVLAQPDMPLVPPGLLGWEAITGYRDKIKGQFYGLVRPTKDPQRWTNKYLSQVMFLLNSQSKGGIVAERGLAEDENQFASSWAKTDEITWVNKNALSGNAPKFQQKPVAQFPAGFFTLYQESKEAINQVTGLSPEFIGTREVDQAGVLEYQRKQSSLSLLAPLFNSLRRYRKRQGKIMLFLIQNHLSDGRLVRIVGDGLAEYVPLTKEEVANSEYDIIIDDAPTSPNEKEKTWQVLQPLFPMLMKAIDSGQVPPTMMLEVLKYSPLPASMVDKWIKMAAQQQEQAAQQPPQPSPEEIKMRMETQKHELAMQGKQMDVDADKQKADIEISVKMLEAYLKQQEAQQKMALDSAKLQNDADRLAIQAQQTMIRAQNANTSRTGAAS